MCQRFMHYLLYDLEDEFEGYRRFKLSCNDELHTLIQAALPVAVYARLDDADGLHLHRITYYVLPEIAEETYANVILLISDYFAGIALGGAWWEFIQQLP